MEFNVFAEMDILKTALNNANNVVNNVKPVLTMKIIARHAVLLIIRKLIQIIAFVKMDIILIPIMIANYAQIFVYCVRALLQIVQVAI